MTLKRKKTINNIYTMKSNAFCYLCASLCRSVKPFYCNESVLKILPVSGKSPNFQSHTGDSNRSAHVICQAHVYVYVIQWRGAVAYLCDGCLAMPLEQVRQHVPRFFLIGIIVRLWTEMKYYCGKYTFPNC
jgi:hypothetical protein